MVSNCRVSTTKTARCWQTPNGTRCLIGSTKLPEAPMSILRRVGNLLAFLSVFFLAAPLSAQRLPDASIPPELRPWVPWVLESVPERDCRKIDDDDIVRVWPGALRLDVGPRGGRF